MKKSNSPQFKPRSTPRACARQLLVAMAALLAPSALRADITHYVATTIEQHDQQTDFEQSTLGDVGVWHSTNSPTVTTAGTLSVNGGTAQTLQPASDGTPGEFEVFQRYTGSTALADAVAANPTNVSYVYTLPTASGNKIVTITGPDGSFADLAPAPLQFILGNPVGNPGNSGFRSDFGWNRLEVKTDDLSSFTVNYTAFSAVTPGGSVVHWLNAEKWVGEGASSRLVEYDSAAPVADNAAVAVAAEKFTVNFVRGYSGSSAFDAETNSYTIGYGRDTDAFNSGVYLEAGYSHLFGLQNAGLGDGTNPDDTIQAMGFGRTIGMNMNFITDSHNVYGELTAHIDSGGDRGYTIASKDYILSENNQLIDKAGVVTYLDVENSQVVINGTNTYSGGTGLYGKTTVEAASADSLGSGVIQLHDQSRLMLGFEANQTFVDRISAFNEDGHVSVLQLKEGYTEENLNFTGHGDLALDGGNKTFLDVWTDENGIEHQDNTYGTIFAGLWTPSGDVYRVGNSVAGHDGQSMGRLVLANDNALTDIASNNARRLEVSGAQLELWGTNSYSGGTTVNYGNVGVFASNGLGTGAVTVNGGGLWVGGGDNSGTPTTTTINNTIKVTEGYLGVGSGAHVTGNVTLDHTGRGGPTGGFGLGGMGGTAFYLDGGHYSGALEAKTQSYIDLHAGTFDGTLTLATGKNHFVRIGDTNSQGIVQIDSAISLNAGDQLGVSGSAVFTDDLTLHIFTVYIQEGEGTLSFTGTAGVHLNDADLMFSSQLTASIYAGTEILLENGGTKEYLILTVGSQGFIDGTFTVDHLFSAQSQSGAYTDITVALEQRLGNSGTTSLYAVFSATSAIPEPSTYAAIFGGVALVGAAVYRRRRSA